MFYGRVYRIVDASDFTRVRFAFRFVRGMLLISVQEYMASVGVSLAPAEALPADPYTTKRDLTASLTQRVSQFDPAVFELLQSTFRDTDTDCIVVAIEAQAVPGNRRQGAPLLLHVG
jgi:hypothetical protein